MTTEIVNDRELGLRLGYAATDWPYDISYEEFVQFFRDWEMRALVRDGAPIGAVFYGPDDELHVSILPEWRKRWLTKSLLVRLLGGRRVTTRVAPGYDFMYGILFKLGFRPHRDGLLVKE